jgi:hypothetical protein
MVDRNYFSLGTFLSPKDAKIFILIVLFSVIIGGISWQALPTGGLDMRDDILPSLHNWMAPWQEGVPLFPWSALIMMPLRLFSARAATALINGLSIIILALFLKRFNGNMLFAIPIGLSPFGFSLFSNGQTDLLVLASLLLPAGFDLLLFWKPQVCAHAFWVRFRTQPRLYLISVAIISLVSFLIWGFWPRDILNFAQTNLLNGWWNRSFWPYSIPLGLGLVYWSIKKRDECYGVMASPLLFPYVNAPSYIGLLAVLACKWPKFFVLSYLLYFLYVVFAVFMPGLHLRIF